MCMGDACVWGMHVYATENNRGSTNTLIMLLESLQKINFSYFM